MTVGSLFIFLRAVNLGRVNKVPMKQLVARIEDAELGACSYLLQSGNLIFSDFRGDVAELKDALVRLILERFEVKSAAVARTSVELSQLVEANTFEAPEGGSVHIAMWDEQPNQAGLEEFLSGDYGEDMLCLAERAAIIRYAAGSHRSKLNNSLLERKLGVVSTARNIRTVERLLKL